MTNALAEFATVIRTETPQWAKVIKDAGIKATDESIFRKKPAPRLDRGHTQHQYAAARRVTRGGVRYARRLKMVGLRRGLFVFRVVGHDGGEPAHRGKQEADKQGDRERRAVAIDA